MKSGQRLWTRDELILAINLYCKLPFGRLHRLNPDIIKLANLIQRTPSSVTYKLVNFARIDPSLKQRGIKGALNASKLDKEIWDEFFNSWDILPYESEKLLAKINHKTIEERYSISEEDLPKEGKLREQIVKTRVNQSFFRGLLTITPEYKVKVSSTILKSKDLETKDFFSRYNDQSIILPSRFLPDPYFLKYHNYERFRQ